MNKNKFNFFIPADISKSKDPETGEEKLLVKGVASTADQDSDDEVLEPKGYILDRFLTTGFVNWNHQGRTDASKIIGYPTKANVSNNQLHIEAELYGESKLAKSVYELGKILAKNKTRRLGWSIEGRALERDKNNPKRITKALITGVAITPSPVNTNTFMDIVKGVQKEDYIDYSEEPNNEILKDDGCLYEIDIDGKKYRLTKSMEYEEVTDKAITVSTLAPLKRESLDKKLKDLEPDIAVVRKCLGDQFIKSVVESFVKSL